MRYYSGPTTAHEGGAGWIDVADESSYRADLGRRCRVMVVDRAQRKSGLALCERSLTYINVTLQPT